jgi:undecaprenyl-phosphate 4-deoxy-4-formamido-L-arabinose transferase
MNKKISFVIPCYGSENTISFVINELKEVMDNNHKQYDYEIIAVNDCSPDNVWGVLLELSKDKRIKLVKLAKNMNRPGALMAGLSFATGDYLVIMDDDGQCPMLNFAQLLKPIEDGHDVAIAKYPVKKQSKFKNFGSFVNKKMTEFIIEKPKELQISNFMILKRYIVDKLLEYTNPYPYLTGLLLRTTSDIVNVEMEERERYSGETTFTFKKMLSLWFNGFTAFSVKPLRISSVMGVLIAFFGFLSAFYAIVNKIANPTVVQGYTSLIAVLLIIGGFLMLMLGIIGEYIGRIYICINNSPQYVVRETVNFEGDDYVK